MENENYEYAFSCGLTHYSYLLFKYPNDFRQTIWLSVLEWNTKESLDNLVARNLYNLARELGYRFKEKN